MNQAKKIISVLSGTAQAVPPIWLMRQAGRYLPEYREVRAQAGSFLDLVYDPERAAEVTVQPVRRFGFDAAILFSDILVVPHVMGADLRFAEGEGPRLAPVQTMQALQGLQAMPDRVDQVMQTVTRVREKLAAEGFDQTTLIGFAGGPWTVACYLVAGSGKDHNFETVQKIARDDPEFFDALVARITAVTIDYLQGQIAAGAEVVQLFESWAAAATGDLFDRYVVSPTRQIVAAIKQTCPQVPLIGFARGAGPRLADYAQIVGMDGLGLGQDVDLATLNQTARPHQAVQGNLDPEILVAGGAALERAVQKILDQTWGRPHIFNLGHGILPHTPIAHVERLIQLVRA